MLRHDAVDDQPLRTRDFRAFVRCGICLPDFLGTAVIRVRAFFLQTHSQPPRAHQIVLNVLYAGMDERIGAHLALVHHLEHAERTRQRRPNRRLGTLLEMRLVQITVRDRLDRLAQEFQIARGMQRRDRDFRIPGINPRQNPHDRAVDQVGAVHVKIRAVRLARPVQTGYDLPVVANAAMEPVPVPPCPPDTLAPLPRQRFRLRRFP